MPGKPSGLTPLFSFLCIPLVGMALAYPGSLSGALVFIAAFYWGLSLGSTSAVTTMFSALCFGAGGWIATAWWLSSGINAMNPSYWWTGYLALTTLALIASLPYVLFGFLATRQGFFANKTSSPLLAAAILSLCVELWPSPLPGSVTIGLSSTLSLIQIADIGGTPLVHFMIFAVGFSAASTVASITQGALRFGSLLMSIALLLSACSYGLGKMSEWQSKLNSAETLRVGLIQPNLPITTAKQNFGTLGSIDSLFQQTSELLSSAHPPQLVVWPEIPAYFSPHNVPDDKRRLDELLAHSSVPLILNADMYTNDTVYGRVPFYNAVQLFHGSGKILQEYRKMILVPLGEYLPFEQYLTGPSFERLLSDVRRYIPGDTLSVLTPLPQLRVGTPVCLELLHSTHVGAMIRLGATLLVSPSNDGYFGDTSGVYVNRSFAVYRAIEYRIPVVRVTNSGLSQVFNQLGDTVPSSELPPFTQSATTVAVVPSAAPLGALLPREQGLIGLSIFSLVALFLRRHRQFV